LTRASILFARIFTKQMDCRVKPGNDENETKRIATDSIFEQQQR
jgi:hypothetical protein